MAMAFSSEPEASTTAPIKPSTISKKYSGGPNLNATLASGTAKAASSKVPIAADEERRQCGATERHAGTPAACHLVAVEAGDHG